MKQLIKPKGLQKGDCIATLSLSGGRAGDLDMVARYEVGKKRLEEVFELKVVEAPYALKGSDYLYHNPKARAEDFMWALQNPEVKGIIANMGGDDAYRLLSYIDFEMIRNYPKIMMGYSDITTLCACYTYAGVMSYYGPNILTPIAQPGKLDDYTKDAITQVLFAKGVIGEVKVAPYYTAIEWGNKVLEEISWHQNKGYKLLQGSGKVKGRLIGGCVGPLQQIMGTPIYPEQSMWEDSILFFDNFSPYGGAKAELHSWRALAASGVFEKAKGLLIPYMNEDSRETLLKFLRDEVHREDLPVLANVEFGHRTPMTILPIGAMAEIDCEGSTLTILESGVL